MKKKTLLILLFVFSFLAIVDGALLTYQHYSTSSSVLCVFGDSFNCNTVSQSAYSTVDNIFYFLAVDMGFSVPIITISIPIAVIAIVLFLMIKLHILHLWHGKKVGRFHPNHSIWAMRILLSISMVYGIWLVYVQKYILQTYCLYCLILDILILLSLVISFMFRIE